MARGQPLVLTGSPSARWPALSRWGDPRYWAAHMPAGAEALGNCYLSPQRDFRYFDAVRMV